MENIQKACRRQSVNNTFGKHLYFLQRRSVVYVYLFIQFFIYESWDYNKKMYLHFGNRFLYKSIKD